MRLKYASRSLLAAFDIIHLPSLFFGLMVLFTGTPLYGVFRMLAISPVYLLVAYKISYVFLAIVVVVYIASIMQFVKKKEQIGKAGIVIDIILISLLVFELVFMNDWCLNLMYF